MLSCRSAGRSSSAAGQLVGRADHRVDGLQAHELLGEARVASTGQRVHPPEAEVGVTGQQRIGR